MKPTMLWTLLVLGCLVAVVQGNCISIIEKVVKCYTDEGLTLTIPSGADAEQVLKDSLSSDVAVCSGDLAAYKTAVSCSLDALGLCLQQLGLAGLMPVSEKVKEGVDYFCQKKDEFDSPCFESKASSLLTCATETFQRVSKEKGDNLTESDIICLDNDISYDCYKKYLPSCSGDTLEIYLTLLNIYQLPSACAGQPPGRPRESYVDSGSSLPSAWPLGGVVSLVALEIYLFLLP